MVIYDLVDGAPEIHGKPRQSMALNGTPWQIYDKLHGDLRPSEISSMALTFSMETASCAQKAAINFSSDRLNGSSFFLLMSMMTAMTSSRELVIG